MVLTHETVTDSEDGVFSIDRAADEELLLRYRRTGQQECFSQLVRRYERELYNYLYKYLGKADMAEDVFQATFVQLHLKCEQFQEGRRFRPWLYAVATNQAIDFQRRNRRHRILSLDGGGHSRDEESGQFADLLASETPGPLQHVSAREREAWVATAMAELSEAARSVIELVYFQGLKYREAAEVLKVPVGTVKSRLHSAITRLSATFEDSGLE
ncbi:MAG: RNA polymerase subunit sigma-70 [Planctomycetaceae bacterium]|nr:RNA polymerase subunit sigma-70 [Planctomycetaceae bacterium]